MDVVVLVVTPQITSFPGKPKLDDERNNDHHFFPQHEISTEPPKKRSYKTLSATSRKDIRKNFTTKNEKTQAKEHLIFFETKFGFKETFASITKLNPVNKLIYLFLALNFLTYLFSIKLFTRNGFHTKEEKSEQKAT